MGSKEVISESHLVSDLFLGWMHREKWRLKRSGAVTEYEFILENRQTLNDLYSEVKRRYGLRKIPRQTIEACVMRFLLDIGAHRAATRENEERAATARAQLKQGVDEDVIIWDSSSPVIKIMQNVHVTNIKRIYPNSPPLPKEFHEELAQMNERNYGKKELGDLEF